jgi:7-cyano-7-deazaguanine tRNA-ribosyltransferase
LIKTPSPCFWFSQSLDDPPEPWKYFKIDGLLLNAYQILNCRRANIQIRDQKIHKYSRFDGPIMMDSGGFLFMRRNRLDVSADEIINLYEDAKPNFGIVLDHPITPDLSPYIIRKRRLRTLFNTARMMELRVTENPEIIPVIHGFSNRSIVQFIKQLQKISEFKTYGIGSLVPSIFNIKGIGGISNVVKTIMTIRDFLPNARLHVFGVGSTTTMNLMFYAGADSVDSSGWRTKAAFGAIQLPGMGDRYVTQRKRNKKYHNLYPREKLVLDKCKCPICRKYGLTELQKSFEARALHNAWVFQQEIENVRELKKSGEYEKYARNRISNSVYRSNLYLIDKLKPKIKVAYK